VQTGPKGSPDPDSTGLERRLHGEPNSPGMSSLPSGHPAVMTMTSSNEGPSTWIA
jgi:hypothetical protein